MNIKKHLLIVAISNVFITCSIKSEHESARNTVHEDRVGNKDSTVLLEKTASYFTVGDTIIKVNFLLDDLLKIESEEELIKKFGKGNVARGYDINDCTLETNPTSILFPNTKNEVRCRWIDTTNFTNLSSVSHYGHKSDWKTSEGIALGTTIDVLEKLNGEPFTFNAFGWDYEGQVIWNYPVKHDKGISLVLRNSEDNITKSLFSTEPLQISSDADSVKTANLAVGAIELWDMQMP